MPDVVTLAQHSHCFAAAEVTGKAPPELLANRLKFDPAAIDRYKVDVFSFGALLHELVAGAGACVPSELTELVSSCMQGDPELRPTMAAVLRLPLLRDAMIYALHTEAARAGLRAPDMAAACRSIFRGPQVAGAIAGLAAFQDQLEGVGWKALGAVAKAGADAEARRRRCASSAEAVAVAHLRAKDAAARLTKAEDEEVALCLHVSTLLASHKAPNVSAATRRATGEASKAADEGKSMADRVRKAATELRDAQRELDLAEKRAAAAASAASVVLVVADSADGALDGCAAAGAGDPAKAPSAPPSSATRGRGPTRAPRRHRYSAPPPPEGCVARLALGLLRLHLHLLHPRRRRRPPRLPRHRCLTRRKRQGRRMAQGLGPAPRRRRARSGRRRRPRRRAR